MLNHGQRAVTVEHRRDCHRCNCRPGSYQIGFAIDVEANDLASRREVYADANYLLLPIAVQPVVGKSSDYASRGYEPRSSGRMRLLTDVEGRHPV